MLASRVAALWRYRELLRNLVARDLRVKYKGSTLGFAWSLLHPLAIAAVYTVAFKYVLRAGGEHFPVFLLSGLLPWMFLTSALGTATGTIGDNGGLVRKVAFPRAILPIAAVTAQLVQFALMSLTILPIALVTGVGLSPAFVSFLPLALLQFLFTAGLALGLSTAYVYFRDTRHLLDVGLQIWFWLTPVVYSISKVPTEFRPYFRLNPMTWFVTAYQNVMLEKTFPSIAALGTLAVIAITTVVAGLAIFSRFERRFAEMI